MLSGQGRTGAGAGGVGAVVGARNRGRARVATCPGCQLE
jgi:hypothetical protein